MNNLYRLIPGNLATDHAWTMGASYTGYITGTNGKYLEFTPEVMGRLRIPILVLESEIREDK